MKSSNKSLTAHRRHLVMEDFIMAMRQEGNPTHCFIPTVSRIYDTLLQDSPNLRLRERMVYTIFGGGPCYVNPINGAIVTFEASSSGLLKGWLGGAGIGTVALMESKE